MIKRVENDVPLSFTLRDTLSGHEDLILRLAWSPNGQILASGSIDKTIRLWDLKTGQQLDVLKGHSARIWGLAWSPDGQILASASGDKSVRLWDVQTGRLLSILRGHKSTVYDVAWSPDGEHIASGAGDGIIIWDPKTRQQLQRLEGIQWTTKVLWSPSGKFLLFGSSDSDIGQWEIQTRQLVRKFKGHTEVITDIIYSPDGRYIASAAKDKTIRLWDIENGWQVNILEGLINIPDEVSFSLDGRLLASQFQGSVHLWRTDRWEEVAILKESPPTLSAIAFNPQSSLLAALAKDYTVIHIWELDLDMILRGAPVSPSVYYTNAKVVLVGDSGVGKTGLGLALAGQPFVPTESTHGRRIWTLDTRKIELDDGRKESHEILLWDLAGQPGYRLIHQLHLNEISVTLIVFDANSETDPFAGIDHWVRAVRLAQRVQGSPASSMKKFLVAARIDRGGKSVSRERIDTLVQELGFDGYFETSAKEGLNMAVLADAIKQAIDWKTLPLVTSSELFQHIKAFLIKEKEAGRLLSTFDDLYRMFLKWEHAASEIGNLREQFDTCIGRLESQGLLRRLSFGSLILLQSELLDAYASALVNAVRDEPDGLGSISEGRIRNCDFFMSKDERIQEKEQEKLLLIAMIEDLLRYEIALREYGDDGPYLVFPAQSIRESPDLPHVEGGAVIFSFEGPIQSIYSTLVVRLSHSGLFKKKELWKNAVTYTTKLGGTYGLSLDNKDEGRAELILFFDKDAREETRFHFEEYVKIHLERRALPETIRRRRLFICPICETPLDDLAVTRRRQRGFNTMICGVCETRVSLLDREERFVEASPSLVLEMDREADMQRDNSMVTSILQGKIATDDFDVFLCHNNKDKTRVKEIGQKLKELGILPWLDEWELRPGLSWQRLLEQQIGKIKSAAVFVGKDGIGPWQHMELDTFLREFVSRGCPVIPVLLPNASKKPELPIFLRQGSKKGKRM
ncbi:MAG: TIR domain-containing protein [Ktedonobacteraceae bacterium]